MIMEEPIQIVQNSVILKVRVSPGAKRSGFEGVWNQSHLRLALRAPAVEGKANKALIVFLADFCHVRQVYIKLEAGLTGRLKQIRIICSDQEKALVLKNKLMHVIGL